MFKDPLFILVLLAIFAVLGILVLGVVTFGRGGEFNRKYANKIMRWRVGAQLFAVAMIMLFIWLRGGDGAG